MQQRLAWLAVAIASLATPASARPLTYWTDISGAERDRNALKISGGYCDSERQFAQQVDRMRSDAEARAADAECTDPSGVCLGSTLNHIASLIGPSREGGRAFKSCMLSNGWELRSAPKLGFGRVKFLSGTTYEGAFSNGEFDGSGVLTQASGNIYSGQWSAGKRHGNGTYTTADAVTDGQWRDDKFVGPGAIRYTDGSVYVINDHAYGTKKKFGFSLSHLDDVFVVSNVQPNGPAYMSGMHRGMVLASANGFDFSNKSSASVAEFLDKANGIVVFEIRGHGTLQIQK